MGSNIFKSVLLKIKSSARNGKLSFDKAKELTVQAKAVEQALSTKDIRKLKKAIDKLCRALLDSEV